jgi:sugar phosphate isomerase/epimerase
MNQNSDADHTTEIRELAEERDEAVAKSEIYGGLDQRREKRAAEVKKAWKEAAERNRHAGVVRRAVLDIVYHPDGHGKRWKDIGTIDLVPSKCTFNLCVSHYNIADSPARIGPRPIRSGPRPYKVGGHVRIVRDWRLLRLVEERPSPSKGR